MAADRIRAGWLIAFLLLPGHGLAAQEPEKVRLEVNLAPTSRDPIVFTRNLLEDTPWLTTLRQGLPIRLQYRLEIWRSRDAWLDEPIRQLDWTLVVRHEPLLDQYTVIRLGPSKGVTSRTVGTAGALAQLLRLGYQFPIAPRDIGKYYYSANLSVATLSDSDLDKFERILRGELDPGGTEGGGLAATARRLILRLAGLPAENVSGQSEQFEVTR